MFADEEHHKPHLHAICHGKKASLSIEPVEILRGGLDNNAERVVKKWIAKYKEELLTAWETLAQGEIPNKIN